MKSICPLVRSERSQKSAKGVHLSDLATYLDKRREVALYERDALQVAACGSSNEARSVAPKTSGCDVICRGILSLPRSVQIQLAGAFAAQNLGENSRSRKPSQLKKFRQKTGVASDDEPSEFPA